MPVDWPIGESDRQTLRTGSDALPNDNALNARQGWFQRLRISRSVHHHPPLAYRLEGAWGAWLSTTRQRDETSVWSSGPA